METAERQLAAAQQENIAILAAFSQAERSLKLAEAACAENVESLRASLEDDTPCPVCGAHEHPYRHNDGPLQAMLGGLQAEVTRCRKQMEVNVNQQAAQRATVQASLEQLQMLATESRGVQQALEKVAAAWSAHALVMGGGDGAARLELPPEAGRTDWFTSELEAARGAASGRTAGTRAARGPQCPRPGAIGLGCGVGGARAPARRGVERADRPGAGQHRIQGTGGPAHRSGVDAERTAVRPGRRLQRRRHPERRMEGRLENRAGQIPRRAPGRKQAMAGAARRLR